MDKQNVVYTYNGILIGHKRSNVLIQATTRSNLRNITQKQKDKYYMTTLLCGNQNRQMRKYNRGYHGINRQLLSNRYRVSTWQEEKDLEMVMAYTTP